MSEPSAHPAPADDNLPPEVSDYDLIRRIGEGGFGQVWLAANRATGLLRAVKVIASHRSGRTDPAVRRTPRRIPGGVPILPTSIDRVSAATSSAADYT